MIFVAIEGGGLRSAYWSAAVLDRLNTESNGEFYSHLFAISGVSGGSLGGFAYSEMARHKRPSKELFAFLKEDYLSPILSGLLFSDALQGVIPTPISKLDNASVFEQSMEDSWATIVKTSSFTDTVDSFRAIDAQDQLPNLYLNTTNVESGRRFIITPRPVSVDEDRGDTYFSFDPDRPTPLGDIRWSTAVSLSARFPLVSPPGLILTKPTLEDEQTWPSSLFHTKPSEVIWGQLVDGGYFDNSGLVTVRDLIQVTMGQITSSRAPDLPGGVWPEIVVLAITNGPSSDMPANSSLLGESSLRRPADPPASMMSLYSTDAGKRQVLSDTGIWTRAPKGTDLDAPLEALFSSRDAKTYAEEKAISRALEDQSIASTDRCRPLINPFQRDRPDTSFLQCHVSERFDIISLADQVQAEVDADSKDELASLEVLLAKSHGPGLGWSLSKRSFDAMDAAANRALQGKRLQVIESLDKYYASKPQ